MKKRSKSKHFFGLLLCRACLYPRLFSISILSLCGVFTLPSWSNAVAPNAQLQDWRFSPEAAQLEFTLSATSQPKVFLLSQPSRLVIDLPGTKLGFVPTQQNYSGAIQRIRLSQLNASVTRIVMDLAPGTAINPNQVLVQPISPTSWVLRLFANFTNNTAPGIYAPQPANNTPPGFYQPLLPNNTAPGIYAPLPPNNTAPGIYAPLPPNNTAPGIYAPLPPNNTAPGIYAPLPPNNAAPGIYQPQAPGLITQPATSFPPTNNDTQQQPFVRVPPLTPNNATQIPGSMLPPATFPNPSGGIVNTPPLISPNYNVPTTVPTYPSNPTSNTNPGVVPWGQSLPLQR
jgi:AMIN domain